MMILTTLRSFVYTMSSTTAQGVVQSVSYIGTNQLLVRVVRCDATFA